MTEFARLFLALMPPPPVRTALIDVRQRWQWRRGAAPVADDKLHLTLHFIGDVARTRIDELRAALRHPVAPFTLEFGASDLWHHGIAVLEPTTVPPELVALHAGLGQLLTAAGLPLEERSYKPHVTMARRAAGSTPPLPGEPIVWLVAGYALMESIGGRYVALQHYP
jgi:2'-5' RNA ligase